MLRDDGTRQAAYERLLEHARSARRLFDARDGRTLVVSLRAIAHELLGLDSRVMAVTDGGRRTEVQDFGSIRAGESAPDTLVEGAVKIRGRVLSESQDRAVAYAGRFGEAQYVIDLSAKRGKTIDRSDVFVIDFLVECFAAAARNTMLSEELEQRRSVVLELSQTKSDLIAMLAHDFRGPLTSIVGFADLIGDTGSIDKDQREYLDIIKRSAMQLSDLASDTLTLSRLERNEVTLQLGDVALDALIESIVEQFEDRRSIEVSAVGDTHVVADSDRLRQVFSNLIDNAIKYSTPATSPVVTIEGGSDSVTVRVRDSGIGVPAGELTRIFDRFSRGSNAKLMRIAGTGFGLFLAKQLVGLHGGSIAVESHEGSGSTFTVTLLRRMSRASTPRTIVILDRRRDRSYLAYGLREAGYRVASAADIEELIAIADSQAVTAVLVATQEPISNERAVQLRTFCRERGIPIVAMATGEVEPLLGASATLTHPVLAGDLINALERLTQA